MPAIWRARTDSPIFAAERFRRRMDLISPRFSSSGRFVVVMSSAGGHSRSFRGAQREIRARRRRVAILKLFLVLTVASAAVGVWRGGGFWEIHLGVDCLLAMYLGLLLEMKHRRVEQAAKVRTMHARPARDLGRRGEQRHAQG